MSSAWDWSQLVVYAVSRSPWLLVLMIGAGLCLRHASDQRRRAVLIGIALLIQFAMTFLSLLASPFLFEFISRTVESREVAQLVGGLLYSLPTAVAFLLILYAAFYGDPRLQLEDAD